MLGIVGAALVVPGLVTAFMARRTGRFRGVLLITALFWGIALVLFALAANAPHDDPDAVGQVLLSFFVMVPAGLSALIGGAIGRMFAPSRRGTRAD